jgi:hypothetical protein
MKVTDRMTREDRAIYNRMPLVGRLMVHRDRVSAQMMLGLTRTRTSGESVRTMQILQSGVQS